MKFKGLAVLLAIALVVSFSCTAMAGKHVLKLGILSAAGGLEDLAANKIKEVAAAKSGGQLEIQVFPAAQLGNFISQMESLAHGNSGHRVGRLGLAGQL